MYSRNTIICSVRSQMVESGGVRLALSWVRVPDGTRDAPKHLTGTL